VEEGAEKEERIEDQNTTVFSLSLLQKSYSKVQTPYSWDLKYALALEPRSVLNVYSLWHSKKKKNKSRESSLGPQVAQRDTKKTRRDDEIKDAKRKLEKKRTDRTRIVLFRLNLREDFQSVRGKGGAFDPN